MKNSSADWENLICSAIVLVCYPLFMYLNISVVILNDEVDGFHV